MTACPLLCPEIKGLGGNDQNPLSEIEKMTAFAVGEVSMSLPGLKFLLTLHRGG